MGEAIVLYRGRGSSVDPELLKPTTITSNGTYTAPITGTYRVSCVGGGGGGGGGCRNSWNSSQVFYGAGGTRGSLNTMNVTLNAGDKVQMNLGSGGAGGTNNTTVISNNSRGTNGGSGGTTTFGSYVSGAGGTYGAWSWSWHYMQQTTLGNVWRSSGLRDMNIYAAEFNTINRSNFPFIGYWTINERFPKLIGSGDHKGMTAPYYSVFNLSVMNKGSYFWAYAIKNNTVYNSGISYHYWWKLVDTNTILDYSRSMYINFEWLDRAHEASLYNHAGMGSPSNYWCGLEHKTFNTSQEAYNALKLLHNYTENNAGTGLTYHSETYSGNWTREFFTAANVNLYPVTKTENKIVNTTTRCYTSIQQGSWWYTSANNVTTSGTRSYRGDGGASGQAGNAGFILIIPPQSA